MQVELVFGTLSEVRAVPIKPYDKDAAGGWKMVQQRNILLVLPVGVLVFTGKPDQEVPSRTDAEFSGILQELAVLEHRSSFSHELKRRRGERLYSRLDLSDVGLCQRPQVLLADRQLHFVKYGRARWRVENAEYIIRIAFRQDIISAMIIQAPGGGLEERPELSQGVVRRHRFIAHALAVEPAECAV